MCSLLKYDQECELKGNLALIQATSHFHRVPPKARAGSGSSNIIQLESEAVHGTVIKILGVGVRQTSPPCTRLSLICCATLNKALHFPEPQALYKMDTITVRGI